MRKTLTLSVLMMILTLSACAPLQTETSAPQSTTAPSASVETQIPITVSPSEADPSALQNLYTNNIFGLSFQYPSDWFILDYVSDDTIRVEVGSDQVYPYGEPPEQPSDVKNSYNIVIQYTKNNESPSWKEDATYQSLLSLQDGESLSDARSQLIRVGELNIGKLKGFEYITTLSETGQTDHFYIRSAMLFNEQTNDLVTIMGQPINVEVGNGADWRNVYRSIDEANLNIFHKIVESITLEPATTRVGIPYVDMVIEAVLADDAQALQEQLRFTEMPCTTQDGLGGPPKCVSGEPEGTPVDVLPFLGSEGHHLRKQDAVAWEGIGPAKLYGGYRTTPNTYSDPFYPAGEFGLVFLPRDQAGAVVFQVSREGIVRIDYKAPVDPLFQEDEVEFILGPIP